jgi:hypothetical protein
MCISSMVLCEFLLTLVGWGSAPPRSLEKTKKGPKILRTITNYREQLSKLLVTKNICNSYMYDETRENQKPSDPQTRRHVSQTILSY